MKRGKQTKRERAKYRQTGSRGKINGCVCVCVQFG